MTIPMDTILVVQAAEYAARKHRQQRRKDADATPYINHPLAVARAVAETGHDTMTVIAALLHDVIEDTQTAASEIAALFGKAAADVVVELTDDKSLPKNTRKAHQLRSARHLSERAKAVRIADKICNVRDVLERRPVKWSDEQCNAYIDWAHAVVMACSTHDNISLVARFEQLVPREVQQ